MRKFPPFRASCVILVVSTSLTLLGCYIISFGYQLAGTQPITQNPFWPVMIIGLGLGGVLMPFMKRLRGRRWVRIALGCFAALPVFGAAVFSVVYHYVFGIAYFLPAMVFVILAYVNDEPGPDKARYTLVNLFAGTVLIMLGLLSTTMPGVLPIAYAEPLSLLFLFVGPLGILIHLRDPLSLSDDLASYIMAAALGVLSFVTIKDGRFAPAIMSLPLVAILVARKLAWRYRLGDPEPAISEEEATIVHQFERLAEMVAWSAFLFTYFHEYFGSLHVNDWPLFALFVIGYAVFTAQYRMRSWKGYSYKYLYRQSLTNAALLSIVSHFTGGLLSPYPWYFIFILINGAFSSEPGEILGRMAIIAAYFDLETLYALATRSLYDNAVINNLLLQVFVIGLTGTYAYRLSSLRKRMTSGLRATNDRLKELVAREQDAKALASRQAKEIAEAKRRDEAVMAALGDGVIAMDRNGLAVLVNPAAEGIIGMAAKDVLDERLRNHLPVKKDDEPDFWVGNYIDSSLNGNAVPLPEDIYIEHADGRRIYVAGMFTPVIGNGKEILGVVMTLRDVTYLREVDQLKSNFLSVAAHQLRTPLSTIRWYLELLNDPDEGKLNKNQKLFAKNAYVSLRRMVELINSLLSVTRVEAGRVPVRPAPIDLQKLTLSILEELKARIDEKKISVHLKNDGKIPEVMLDPQLSREVFTNLIDNAIRYTPADGTIVITVEEEDADLHWSIADNGIGIPKEQQGRIFEKFYRAPNALSTASEGTGLGLYLAKFIVGTWGGSIGFESTEGKGTTFHVSVPKAGMKMKSGSVSLHA